MTDYYQRMRESCAQIVESATKRCSEHEGQAYSGNLNDVLEMAKWVAMDRDEYMAAYKESLEKAMAKGVEEALLKSIEQELAK